MRNFILGASFGVGIGIAALLLLRAGSDSPEVPPREPAPAATPSPTLESSSQGDEATLHRLATVEAERLDTGCDGGGFDWLVGHQ